MDNKTFELSTYEGALQFPEMIGFNLFDFTDSIERNSEVFWIDLFESLLSGYGMLLEYIIFCKDNKKEKYYPNLCVDKIKEHVERYNLNVQFAEVSIDDTEDKKYGKRKCFSVFSPESNRQLIEINCSGFAEEIWFSAYIKECADISLINDFSPAIIIADKDVVFLNLKYYPKVQLIERINKVAK